MCLGIHNVLRVQNSQSMKMERKCLNVEAGKSLFPAFLL